MKKLLTIIIAVFAFSTLVSAQTKTRPKPVPKAVPKVAPTVFEKGTVENSQYTNKYFGFTFPIPEDWNVQEEIIGKIIKSEGAKSTKAKTAAVQKEFDKAQSRLTVALTVFKNPVGSEENASIVLSLEDVSPVPAVKDAVDYLQLMITTFKQMQLPPDMKYTEVKAEKLGSKQFGYIDVTRANLKQRMYATVKKNYAILFVFSYTNDEDLEIMRTMLANGNFFLK